MGQDTIKCPSCGSEIKLSQAIQQEAEAGIRQSLEREMEGRAKGLAAMARKEVEEKMSLELGFAKDQLQEKTRLLQKAERQELEMRKRQLDLEERHKSLELEIARTLERERQQIAEKAWREFEEKHKFKDAEKEKQLGDMRAQIEELKRRSEQGSQQAQGEVLEIELEQMLSDEFQFDDIDPVSKGIKGGDVIQAVKTQGGRACGKILWETKRTKSWSDSWIQKLKDDLRQAKADIGVIVSEALPKGFHHFRQVEGIWVTDIPSALSLALALRVVLMQVAKAREVQTGKEGKMEVVYNYLTGTEFRNRIQAIMEAFIGMRQDLDAEKRAMEKGWAKKEKQIEKVVLNLAGMHGDLEGMTGMTLPAMKLMELPSGGSKEDSAIE